MLYKNILCCLAALLAVGLQSAAQTNEQSSTFLNARAVKCDACKDVVYNTEGYVITKAELQEDLEKANMNRIKKSFAIPQKDTARYAPPFPGTRIYKYDDTRDSILFHYSVYFTQKAPGKVWVITFMTPCDRDSAIEEKMYNAILNDAVPGYVSTSLLPKDSVRFAGRKIMTEPGSKWADIWTLSSYNRYNSLSWSEFSNRERALQLSNFFQNYGSRGYKLLEESDVPITFEGKEVIALKRIFVRKRAKRDGLLLNNYFVDYVITAEVRGRYVTCLLSHPTEDPSIVVLRPLMKQLMRFKNH
ncbi:hypothetical protein C7475_101636 [Chitinophaga sp. S165]|nr:hypothetical protein C7475_101636 [Chitinophaga sp. S165]